MSQINVKEFIKESLKIKGSIDVKKSTANKLKELEKNGVQIGLLIAGILDDLDFDSMFKELGIEDEKREEGSEIKEHSYDGND